MMITFQPFGVGQQCTSIISASVQFAFSALVVLVMAAEPWPGLVASPFLSIYVMGDLRDGDDGQHSDGPAANHADKPSQRPYDWDFEPVGKGKDDARADICLGR